MDCGLLHVSTLIFLSSQCRSLSDSWRTTMDILRHFFALAYAFKFRHLHPAFINIPCEFYFDLNQSVFSTVYTVLKLCGCQHRAIKEKQIKNWYTSLKAGSFIFLFWPKATTILQLPSVPVYQCTSVPFIRVIKDAVCCTARACTWSCPVESLSPEFLFSTSSADICSFFIQLSYG